LESTLVSRPTTEIRVVPNSEETDPASAVLSDGTCPQADGANKSMTNAEHGAIRQVTAHHVTEDTVWKEDVALMKQALVQSSKIGTMTGPMLVDMTENPNTNNPDTNNPNTNNPNTNNPDTKNQSRLHPNPNGTEELKPTTDGKDLQEDMMASQAQDKQDKNHQEVILNLIQVILGDKKEITQPGTDNQQELQKQELQKQEPQLQTNLPIRASSKETTQSSPQEPKLKTTFTSTSKFTASNQLATTRPSSTSTT